jgi:hypothetical protein
MCNIPMVVLSLVLMNPTQTTYRLANIMLRKNAHKFILTLTLTKTLIVTNNTNSIYHLSQIIICKYHKYIKYALLSHSKQSVWVVSRSIRIVEAKLGIIANYIRFMNLAKHCLFNGEVRGKINEQAMQVLRTTS